VEKGDAESLRPFLGDDNVVYLLVQAALREIRYDDGEGPHQRSLASRYLRLSLTKKITPTTVNTMARMKTCKENGPDPRRMGMGPMKITAPPDTDPVPESRLDKIMRAIPMKTMKKPVKKRRRRRFWG
jgi:hypothetical protein